MNVSFVIVVDVVAVVVVNFCFVDFFLRSNDYFIYLLYEKT